MSQRTVFTSDTIVIFDTEATAWAGSREHDWSRQGEAREIVQIGAVKASRANNYQVIDTFLVYVKPRINPVLSDYFRDLTGITQDEVDRLGVSFPEAVDQFIAFLGDDTGQVGSNGPDYDVMELNCRYWEMKYPLTHVDFVNLKPHIVALTSGDDAQVESWNLHNLIGRQAQHSAHDGLGDALNILGFLHHMAEAGRIL